MSNTKIMPVAKITFWTSLAFGNFFLFGYFVTRNESFALGGYMLLIVGSIVNLLVITGLLVYAIKNPEIKKLAERSALLLLLNIPVAIIYTIIGINIL